MTEKPKGRSASAAPPPFSKATGNVPAGVASDGSRPFAPKVGTQTNELLSSLTLDFQLTARFRYELTRRQQSLILEVLVYQAVNFGVNFGMWLAMEMALSSLLGKKTDWRELKDSNERRVCGLAYIILGSLKNAYLTFGDLEQLPKQVANSLANSGMLLDPRTYGSRFSHWRPEKFIEVRAVPLESLIERKGNSERYSAYCKGYGESHPSAHRQRTMPSAELDGEPDRPFSLSWEELIQTLYLNSLDLYREGQRHRKT